MSDSIVIHDRRRILTNLALGAGGLASYGFLGASGAFAEELLKTPRQSAGPFYPKEIPLDSDNDLIIVGDSTTPAIGQITHLRGRVLSSSGEPIRNARVEIWQVDNDGVYQHTGSARRSARADKNFQGFGAFETASSGEYYFRTIKPVSYPGRTAHIHFAIKLKGRDRWTTQCYVRGEARNERDWLFNRVKDPRARESILVDFLPDRSSRLGEFNANFDIVLGLTPAA